MLHTPNLFPPSFFKVSAYQSQIGLQKSACISRAARIPAGKSRCKGYKRQNTMIIWLVSSITLSLARHRGHQGGISVADHWKEFRIQLMVCCPLPMSVGITNEKLRKNEPFMICYIGARVSEFFAFAAKPAAALTFLHVYLPFGSFYLQMPASVMLIASYIKGQDKLILPSEDSVSAQLFYLWPKHSS